MSVTGLRLKYMGLYIVTYLLARAAQDASHDGMEIEVEDLEDRRRRQNESRCMEDG